MAKSENCYCAFCKSQRSLYKKKHIDWTNVLLSVLASVLVSLIFWQGFDPRLIVIFSLSLMLAEIFVQVRWRLGLSCPHCGFDPVLYLKNPESAALRVKLFFEGRQSDPRFIFSKSPLWSLLKARQPQKRAKPHAASPREKLPQKAPQPPSKNILSRSI